MITKLNIDAISDGSIPASKLQERYVLSTTPPNNEIWYTSTDGNVVAFNPQSSCGANVVSNTYVDGKGVIKFDGEINAIGNSSFESRSTLKTVSLPDSVVETKDYSFRWCTNLEHVDFGKGIKKIGYQTFWMSGYKSKLIIEIPNTVTTIGDGALTEIANETLVIPDSVTSLGVVAQGNKKLKTVVIGNGVTKIPNNAFGMCQKLENVTIPNSVTEIGSYAFYSCISLTSITIPKSVTSLSDAFFVGGNLTGGLKSVYCKPVVPPNASSSLFGNHMLDAMTIYVPIESVDAYKAANGWSEYANSIVGCVFEDEALVSGVNIKTVNGKSILGEGDITIDSNSESIKQIDYSSLRSLRDNSDLTPGQQYQIIDYVTTTTQANTSSAGHQFDIIVTADDVNVLNENARACLHEGDTYFADCNLSAWEIKYSIDNDTTRFTWVDSNGKGVIYYMKDENDNECPYDFKNIMFIRYKLDYPEIIDFDDYLIFMEDAHINIQAAFEKEELSYIWAGSRDYEYEWFLMRGIFSDTTGETKAFYTFSNIIDGNVKDTSIGHLCRNNVIKGLSVINELNNNVFFGTCQDNIIECGCSNNSFGYCFRNTLGTGCVHNILYDCDSNSFGTYCYNNVLRQDSYNIFGHSCSNNSLRINCAYNKLGDNFDYNSFGMNCSYNIFSAGSCSENIFGNDCYFNIFGNDCYSNIFGNNCNDNIFGNRCGNNNFRNDCRNNSFGNNCYSNSFGYNCRGNRFGNYCNNNSFGNECSSNSFGNECSSNSFGNNCDYSSFGNDCNNNSFGNNCRNNSFGEGCRYIKFGNTTKNKDYYRYITVESGCQYIYLNCTSTTSSTKYFQNIHIGLGVNNTTTYKTISNSEVSQQYETKYVPAGSKVLSV